VVTELRPELDEPLEEPPALPELVELVEPVEVRGALAPEPPVDPAPFAELEALRLARAGSWPLIRVTAISSHRAANSATAPPTTQRRMVRTRAKRALRIEAPGARGSVGLEAGIRLLVVELAFDAATPESTLRVAVA
jgi:hypothetical protein